VYPDFHTENRYKRLSAMRCSKDEGAPQRRELRVSGRSLVDGKKLAKARFEPVCGSNRRL
jgi:hypothetical protein